jgi:4-amino-4-deoxy-L-arabinose transferase-like glycosyltransferase
LLLRSLQGWSSKQHAGPLLLVALSIPLILYGLDRYSLVNGDEAVYHGIAEGMVASGDWLQLDFRSEHRVYDTVMNAPLQYWARAALISLFGSSLWTARILSALFAVASVLLTERVGRRLWGPGAGLLAGLVQLTTLQFVFLHSARTGELEPMLAFFLTLVAWMFLRTVDEGRSWLPHHLCLAILANLKLPIALIPLAAELLCFALHPAARRRLRSWGLLGVALLPIGLGWHAYQIVVLGDAFWQTLATMTSQASGSIAAGPTGGPLANAVFYVSVLWFGAFPWSLVYPIALLRLATASRSFAEWSLALYGVSVFAFFLMVSKHAPWYLVPAFPFLSLAVGRWLSDLCRGAVGSWDALAAPAVLALVVWTRDGGMGYDPFALPAIRVPMPMSWRTLGVFGPALGIPLAALALAGLAWMARARGLSASSLGRGFTVVLLGWGLLRVSLPLAQLEHRSDLAQLSEDLERRRAEGIRIDFPIELPLGSLPLARYYFAEHFRIGLAPGDAERPAATLRLLGLRR